MKRFLAFLLAASIACAPVHAQLPNLGGSGDLSLAAGSPALNNGTQAIPMAVPDDFTRLSTRPQGGADDVGAFERIQ